MDPEKKLKRLDNIRKVLGPLPGDPRPETGGDGRPRYVVRIGDHLVGIARRHPMLNDHEMWRLLALVNGLSTETDPSGKPVAQLRRGMTLILPMPDEIHRYRTGKLDVSKEREA